MGHYATDGKCHNSQPGTFGHECEKPAVWIGATEFGASAFRMGFCARCKEEGFEARSIVSWEKIAS